jgi:hypothetical protein
LTPIALNYRDFRNFVVTGDPENSAISATPMAECAGVDNHQ